MSEYQYYEFQAVDRPLTAEQMVELRALSTRAAITPNRLVNIYHWGSFKGDPDALMAQYFDAFVYMANWGSHRLMFRLPRRLLDPRTVHAYAAADVLEASPAGESLILEFSSEEEDGHGWIEDEESARWMPALLPLRADLAGGDLRALYLAWLSAAEGGLLEDDEVEPPVPPGLAGLSAPLKSLAAFLRVGEDLLAAAAESSPKAAEEPGFEAIERWVSELPVSEKDALLVRLVTEEGAQVRGEILQRFRHATAPPDEARAGARTVADLLSAAKARAETRRREDATREAAARAKHLDGLVGREDELWSHADWLASTKHAKDYDQAVQVLTDLRDLAARHHQAEEFAARLGPLREKYARRPSLLARLDRAGLST